MVKKRGGFEDISGVLGIAGAMESDSETFDTEGLSMMDINDIIGVQNEPTSDTLESEIDALSKMISSDENEVEGARVAETEEVPRAGDSEDKVVDKSK